MYYVYADDRSVGSAGDEYERSSRKLLQRKAKRAGMLKKPICFDVANNFISS